MSDPYEQQLLAVFESCDVTGTGRLDCEGLSQLCDQLHLEDGRSQLMDCLLPAFTFEQFRDALLALLGAARRHSNTDRDPSPEREVSPKFVFGEKKYGRRSRPESSEQEEDDADVESDDDDKTDCDTFLPGDSIRCSNTAAKKQPPSSLLIDDCNSESEGLGTPTSVQAVVLDKEEIESPRGKGEAELRSAWHRLGVGRDGYLDPTELAMVCRAVGMEKMADDVVTQVFAKLDIDTKGRISFEEFLQLFRSTHNSSGPPSIPHHSPSPLSAAANTYQQQNLNSLDVTSSGYVNIESLTDLWEAGGVVNAAGLLNDLGVSVSSGSEVSLGAVAAILEEEVRSMANKSVPSPQVNALTAALVLAQAQLKWLRSCLEQMTGERDKLHVDLAEANQRAALLAFEVDDSHARMERASQAQIKLLEQRHAEQVKQLSLQLAMDRDQLTAATLRLEKRLAQQQEEESKLRSTVNSLHSECKVLEKENQSLSEQLAACDMVKSKAERDHLEIEQLQQRVQELESSSEQLEKLVGQLAKLKTENTNLRDRNDELTIQVENLSVRPICKRQNSSTSLEGVGVGGGTKRRGNSPLALPPEHSWDEESPRLGKVRRYCADPDLSLDSVPMEGLAIGRTLCHSESGLEADFDTLDNSFTMSSPSVDKVTFNIGCGEDSYLSEIERLRSTVAELQRVNEEYRKRLVKVKNISKNSFDHNIVSAETVTVQAVEAQKESGEEEKECSSSSTMTLTTESTEVQTSLTDSAEVNLLEKHCHQLRHTLENVKDEILKILSEKKACSEENCALKERIEDLSRWLPKTTADEPVSLENSSGPLTFTISRVPNPPVDSNHLEPVDNAYDNVKDSPQNVALKCFPFMNRTIKVTDSPYCLFPTKDNHGSGDFKFENLSQFAFELSQSLSDPNSTDNPFPNLGCKPLSPCLSVKESPSVNRKLEFSEINLVVDSAVIEKEEIVSSEDKMNCDKEGSVTDKNSESTELVTLRGEVEKLTKENQELETSLELLRVEYEKCEDYWQGKLNEERAIFDQEQRLSDEKFVELEAKIQEYAELFSLEDKKTNNQLPTIEERDSLEKQVTDLEEEFEEFRNLAQKECQQKAEEVERLMVKLEELQRAQNIKQQNTDRQDVEVQTTDHPCEFRLHEPRSNTHSQACVPVIEVTAPDGIECCCSCHSLSRKTMTRLRNTRARLQSECDMLHRRREIILHQLTQLHHRTNLIYTPMPDRRLASDVEMFHNLSSRLRHQDLRCRHLQSALKHHQRQTDKLLQSAWEQYKTDLSAVQKTLNITQEKLLHQTKLCKQQMERLSSSDVLVKDLYKENAHLLALVQKLEEKNLFVDQSILSSTV